MKSLRTMANQLPRLDIRSCRNSMPKSLNPMLVSCCSLGLRGLSGFLLNWQTETKRFFFLEQFMLPFHTAEQKVSCFIDRSSLHTTQDFVASLRSLRREGLWSDCFGLFRLLISFSSLNEQKFPQSAYIRVVYFLPNVFLFFDDDFKS